MHTLIDRQAAIDAVSGCGICIQKVLDIPPAQPECEKNIIQKFHDYQVEWLTAHCDLELEETIEEWVIRFLHDTANCFMLEMEVEDGKA